VPHVPTLGPAKSSANLTKQWCGLATAVHRLAYEMLLQNNLFGMRLLQLAVLGVGLPALPLFLIQKSQNIKYISSK
jgi:hypothetical protein